jgi:fatty-acyl-CoA synthase
VTDSPETQEIVGCGRAFPGHEIKIVDPDTGATLDDGKVGEIVTRGPSICPGYFDEPEMTAQTFRNGWLHSGDLGYLVKGELFICGRIKDIIIIRGRNFYPQDVEWIVSELPGVRRGNVVAFGVDVNGEEHLVVVAEAAMSEAEKVSAEIASAIAAQMALTVHKVEIIPQGSLPRTSSGKPQRRKTRQMFIDGALPKVKAVPANKEEEASA